MSFPAASYMNNASRTQGEMKQALEDLNKAAKQIPGAGAPEQTLTLATDVITPVLGGSGIIAIETEGAAPSDNLATIAQTNFDDNSLLILHNANTSRVVVVKHNAGGTGQITLKSAGDVVLADPDRHWLMLKRVGTSWKEVARYPAADLVPMLSKSGNYTTGPADRGVYIDCTATLTLTLLAAATAGKGFEQTVHATGGTITIDPNGAETIGGLATLILQRGDRVTFFSDGTNWHITSRFSAHGGLPVHGQLWGLTVSNNGSDAVNDIDVAVGEAMSDDADFNDQVVMRLTSGLTKQLDAVWAVGNNAGMKSGTALADGTWHIFLIMRPDTGVVDIFADTSLSPTLPTNYTKKRRIFSLMRVSATIRAFVHDGDFVQWTVPTLDINVTNPGTSAVTRVLAVPTGLNLLALFNYHSADPSAGNAPVAYFSDLSTTDAAASNSAAPLGSSNPTATNNAGGMNKVVCRTDTAASVRSRVSASSATSVVRIATLGYFDRRGRDN